MKLLEAEQKAKEIVDLLSPFCEKIMIVGSIRRKKSEVKDIDLVAIPKNRMELQDQILRLGVCTQSGLKSMRVFHKETQVDIYFAMEETWGTLVLIRTGSAENNRRLCSLAKRKGWQLKAGGEGLVDPKTGMKIAGDEESIFAALGLKYLPPEQRA